MLYTKSELITEGLRKSFYKTDCKMANRICYGYTTDANGKLVINETAAMVVRFIFERYLGGDSFGKIATALEKQGIDPPFRVAAYCRVSSPSGEQELSLETQVTYYTYKINGNPLWVSHSCSDDI